MFRATALALVLLAGPAVAETPRVAADIGPVGWIVSAVLGDESNVDVVLGPNMSPHGAALRPSSARALERADMVVWVGPELTPGLAQAIEQRDPDSATLTLGSLDGLVILPAREGGGFGEGHHHGEDAHGHDDDDHADDHADEHADEHGAEHDHGHDEHAEADHDDHASDEHAGTETNADPHLWLSPENALLWSRAIAEALTELTPSEAERYAENAAAFEADVLAAQQAVSDLLAPVAGRPFLAGHDAYQYFEAAFNLEAIGAISASDAEAPSAGDLADLKADAAKRAVDCVAVEPGFNAGLIDAVLPDARRETIDQLGRESSDYPTWLTTMGEGFARCLGASSS